jgi:hypothetical protein
MIGRRAAHFSKAFRRREGTMIWGERPETMEFRFQRFMEGLREIDRQEAARKAAEAKGQVRQATDDRVAASPRRVLGNDRPPVF